MARRKIVLLLLILLLLISTLSLSYGANTPQYLHEAEKLNVLSIFKGSDKGFELERQPTRLEAGIIFVRLMGGEEEALENMYPHPFTDVPKWGQSYVGFLYKHKLTKGISETKFGSRKTVRSSEYMTMALRSIGYHDEGLDFKWRKSLEKALELELVDQPFFDDLKKAKFLRDHVVKISYDLLKQPVNGSTDTLAEKLLAYGTFTQDVLDKMETIKLDDPDIIEPDSEATPDSEETEDENSSDSSTDGAIEDATPPAVSQQLDKPCFKAFC